MTDPPESLAAALAQLQAQLPVVEKTKTGKVSGVSKATGKPFEYGYAYADLTDVSSAVMPLMGRLGLSFLSKPTVRKKDGKFGLRYKLTHVSGEQERGFWPIDDRMSPQQIGGYITYARRYVLCAVTGLTAEEDTDAQGAQSASAARKPRGKSQAGPPPERAPANLPRNVDGSLSRSQIMDTELAAAGVMTSEQQAEHTALRKDAATGRVPGAERLTATPDDDPWYDAPPPGGAVRAPVAAGNPASVIALHFQRLGLTDRGERLKATAALAGRSGITSTNDLTAGEAKQVKAHLERCRDRAALDALLAAIAPPRNLTEPGPPAIQGHIEPAEPAAQTGGRRRTPPAPAGNPPPASTDERAERQRVMRALSALLDTAGPLDEPARLTILGVLAATDIEPPLHLTTTAELSTSQAQRAEQALRSLLDRCAQEQRTPREALTEIAVQAGRQAARA